MKIGKYEPKMVYKAFKEDGELDFETCSIEDFAETVMYDEKPKKCERCGSDVRIDVDCWCVAQVICKCGWTKKWSSEFTIDDVIIKWR
jgi:hypothetical protein